MAKTIRIYLILIFIVSGHNSLMAQHADTLLAPVKIKTYQYPSSFLSPVPLQQLSDSAIQRLNSFSVADALRYFSGLQVKDYGGIGGLKTVNTRSLGVNHTALFYDGVPIGNMQNGQVDLGKFSLDNIEEIRLYNAGNSDMLQPAIAYASGAAIYLKSREPRFGKNQKQHLKATFRTGSFGLINPSLLWQQKLNNNYALSVSGEHVNANGRYKFRSETTGGYDTTAVRENADVHAWRLEAGLHAAYADSSRWDTHVYYYHSERGLPGAVVSNRFTNPQRLWDRNFFAQSVYRKKISSFYQILLTSKYSYDYTHYFDPDIVSETGALNNYYRAKEYYLSAANRLQLLPYWSVLISGDYRYNTLSANLNNFAYPKRQTFLALAATDFSWNRLQLQGNLLATYVRDKVQSGPAQPNRDEYTPTFSASWQPLAYKGLRVRGFYKNIFRMPTFNDLYYTGIGYTNLKPELAKQYDLGLTWMQSINPVWQYISVQTDAYYNRITDKIVALPSANLFRWRMVNLGKVAVKGLGASIRSAFQWDSEVAATLGINYTYEKAINKTEGSVYGYPVPYSPVNSGSATLQISYQQKWECNYSFLYTGSRYNATDITLSNVYMQPWYTHDISLKRHLQWGKYHLVCTGEINNVFNQQYEVILNYPMPGRNYRFSVSLDI